MSDADFIREVEELYQCIAEADTDNFVELAKIAGVDIKTDLVGTDLRAVNLNRGNLFRADLRAVNLSKANLSEANLSKANLSEAFLNGANLSRANLSRANLNGANLIEANLSGTDLNGAYLKNSQIDEKTTIADKWRLVWEIVNIDRNKRRLTGVDLSYANLKKSFLAEANLIGADLTEAILTQVNLTDADLSGSNLEQANLIEANLTGVSFNNAIVKDAHFGSNTGMSRSLQQDLIARGAIFEDSPGDRSGVLVPV